MADTIADNTNEIDITMRAYIWKEGQAIAPRSPRN